MCECIKEVEQKIKEQHHGCAHADILNKTLIPANTMFSQVELTYVGKKRRSNCNIYYDYCPFCGEKYIRPTEDANVSR